jgi:hypothetical protein
METQFDWNRKSLLATGFIIFFVPGRGRRSRDWINACGEQVQKAIAERPWRSGAGSVGTIAGVPFWDDPHGKTLSLFVPVYATLFPSQLYAFYKHVTGIAAKIASTKRGIMEYGIVASQVKFETQEENIESPRIS